jgi:hypothetical protein
MLLEVILTTASGLASREGALVITLASVDAHMTGKVTRGGEWTTACRADVLLLGLFDWLRFRLFLEGLEGGFLAGSRV